MLAQVALRHAREGVTLPLVPTSILSTRANGSERGRTTELFSRACALPSRAVGPRSGGIRNAGRCSSVRPLRPALTDGVRTSVVSQREDGGIPDSSNGLWMDIDPLVRLHAEVVAVHHHSGSSERP